MRRRSTFVPPGVFRSRTIPRLLRFIIRNEADSSPTLGGTDLRVSSPSGVFSILMTSAPMSASMSVQVGPAITCVRSTTFSPVNGPVMMNVSPLHLDDGLCTDAGFSPACTRPENARGLKRDHDVSAGVEFGARIRRNNAGRIVFFDDQRPDACRLQVGTAHH